MGFTPSQRDAPVSAQSGIEIIPVMEDKDGYKAILRSWRSLCLFECCLNTSVNISVPFCYIHVTLHVLLFLCVFLEKPTMSFGESLPALCHTFDISEALIAR